MSATKGVPEGMQAVIPYLVVQDAPKALAFYCEALGASERLRMSLPGSDRIMHAELLLGGCVVMLTEEMPERGALAPPALGGSAVSLMIYVPDCDATIASAERGGASVVMPAADMFWGDRMGMVKDPFGHSWMVATHQRVPTPAEMAAALEAMAAGGQG